MKMKNFKSFISEEEKKSGKEIKSGKNSVKINPDSESLKEAEIQPPAERLKTDRNMYNIPADEREAAKQRLLAKAKAAREKRMNNEAKWYDPMEDPDFDPKEAEKKRGVSGKNNPKKGKPVKIEEGDYWHPDPKKDRTLSNRGAKLRAREDGKTSTAVGDDSNRLRPGESYMDYARRKGGSMTVKKKPSGVRNKLKSVLGLKNSYEFEEDMVEEGMTLKDFKANRRKLKRREASADAKKRGHVGKEWYNSGRTYSPDEAQRSRANMDDAERRTRHRTAVDPDNEDDNNYSADRTKNPKKQRKQTAMGEKTMMSFSQYIAELNRYEKETGINTKTNKPTQTGGAKDDKAFTMVKKSIRKMEGTPAGQRKKVPGKKPPTAGQYGGPPTPKQKLAKRKADAQRAQDNMSSRFD
jgi:hypothetical protein